MCKFLILKELRKQKLNLFHSQDYKHQPWYMSKLLSKNSNQVPLFVVTHKERNLNQNVLIFLTQQLRASGDFICIHIRWHVTYTWVSIFVVYLWAERVRLCRSYWRYIINTMITLKDRLSQLIECIHCNWIYWVDSPEFRIFCYSITDWLCLRY